MTCISPITAWKKRSSSLTDNPYKYYKDKKIKFKKPGNAIINDYEQIKIACGHCTGCLLDKSNMWATRIALETKEHEENCFITLTYSPKKVPITKNGHLTLCKKDFQDFIKRLRSHLQQKISYYLVGEYGSQTFRPHGHLCLFGWKPKDLIRFGISKTKNDMYTSEELTKIWGNGHVIVQDLNYKTACYTARYCQKKAGIKPMKRIATGEIVPDEKIDERTGEKFYITRNKLKTEKTDQYGREKEFTLMSKKPAIGLKSWEKHKEQYKNNEGILLKIDDKVQKKPIPRYFKKIWEKTDMSEFDTYRYHEKTQAEHNHLEKLKKINSTDKEKTLLQTIKYNLLKRANLLKRQGQ